MFRSRQTPQFRQRLAALPADVQRQAERAYQLFRQNPRHPSLSFKAVPTAGDDMYSAHVGERYRVLGKLVGDTIYWTWIGSHEAYNRIVKQHKK
jgi:mRNA-degrading endonuclease RelE of RelBE toxin-antitoxin system